MSLIRQIGANRKVRYLALALILITIACFVMGGITIGPVRRAQLERARAAWEHQQMSSYRMAVTFGSFCLIKAVVVTVENRHVTKIDSDATVPFATSPAMIRLPADQFCNLSASLPASLNDYTMDQLFTFAVDKLKDEPLITWCSTTPRYEVSYDSNMGYITDLRHTSCPHYDVGLGLMCPAISECSSGFRITNFTPLAK